MSDPSVRSEQRSLNSSFRQEPQRKATRYPTEYSRHVASHHPKSLIHSLSKILIADAARSAGIMASPRARRPGNHDPRHPSPHLLHQYFRPLLLTQTLLASLMLSPHLCIGLMSSRVGSSRITAPGAPTPTVKAALNSDGKSMAVDPNGWYFEEWVVGLEWDIRRRRPLSVQLGQENLRVWVLSHAYRTLRVKA